MSPSVEVARMQWREGEARLRALEVPARQRETFERVTDEIAAELRRRVGDTFTLAQLAAEYDVSERWARDVALRIARDPAAHDLSLVGDAAFNRVARWAVDFRS